MAANNIIDDTIKEGYVELQKKTALGGSSFLGRYMIVKKNGTVDLYRESPKIEANKEPKETFQLQGEEEIESAKLYKNRYRIQILIREQKKHQKWLICFETYLDQVSWLKVFRSVHKHIHALANLQEVLTGSNADTMEGQLLIASALAECGHLTKAHKIYAKLISVYGQESTQVHEQYEIFLSSQCNDRQRAEQHFVNRLKFFCLPKEIRDTKVGVQLLQICQRIEFLSTMKNTLLDHEANDEYEAQIGYKNIENIWPCYLYFVPTKHLQKARTLATQFFQDTNRNIAEYRYESTYEELEDHAWDIIKQCVDGKKGVVKLRSRLDLVMRAEVEVQIKSKQIGIAMPHSPNESRQTSAPSDDDDDDGNNIPIQPHRSGHDFAFPTEISQTLQSEDLGDLLQALDHLDDIDFSDSDDDIKGDMNGLHTTLSPQPENGYRKIRRRSSTTGMIDFTRDRVNTEDIMEILDPTVDNEIPRALSLLIEDKTYVCDGMFDVFNAIDSVLYDDEHRVFPWTLFMLIWTTRRDSMDHIVANKENTQQIQVILELIYIFVRGCMVHFESSCSEYTLLLHTLYKLANETDHEDVQYKMCLSGVRVIGRDETISMAGKRAMGRFMATHEWFADISSKSQSKQSAIHAYFIKGLRDELMRIHESLNALYDTILYTSPVFHYLKQIRTKSNVVTEISSQCHDKIQGIPTWGPRFENKYNPAQFTFVCQHRQISPIPRPTEKPGDFDECYLLFCLAVASKLNPYFQRQICTALSGAGLDFTHYEKRIKDKSIYLQLMKNQLKEMAPPKAARILDFCACVVAFNSVSELVKGFAALDDKFKICKIVNIFGRKYANMNNYQYIHLYILCKHPKIKLLRLICEVRLVLHQVHQLYEERKMVKECFGNIVKQTQINSIQKEIACITGNHNAIQSTKKKRSATHK